MIKGAKFCINEKKKHENDIDTEKMFFLFLQFETALKAIFEMTGFIQFTIPTEL